VTSFELLLTIQKELHVREKKALSLIRKIIASQKCLPQRKRQTIVAEDKPILDKPPSEKSHAKKQERKEMRRVL
jgi:hypothetical protein